MRNRFRFICSFGALITLVLSASALQVNAQQNTPTPTAIVPLVSPSQAKVSDEGLIAISDTNGGIVLYAPNTQTSTVQTSDQPSTNQVAWSRDGKTLFFISHDKICKVALGDTLSTCLTFALPPDALTYGIDALALSPDNQKIAFTITTQEQDKSYGARVYIANVDGSNALALTDGLALDNSPVFSPDGSQIVFNRITKTAAVLYTMNLDGTKLTLLPIRSVYRPNEPVFSPDGKSLAFTATLGRIYVFDLKTKSVRQLTRTRADQRQIPAVTSKCGLISDVEPSWSADSSYVVFLQYSVVSGCGTDIYAVKVADGTVQAVITGQKFASGPAWQPQPERMAAFVTPTPSPKP